MSNMLGWDNTLQHNLMMVKGSKAWSSWHGDNPITHKTLTANMLAFPFVMQHLEIGDLTSDFVLFFKGLIVSISMKKVSFMNILQDIHNGMGCPYRLCVSHKEYIPGRAAMHAGICDYVTMASPHKMIFLNNLFNIFYIASILYEIWKVYQLKIDDYR